MSVNPWPSLPGMSPYVLPEDATTIAAFNATVAPHHVIHLEIIPEPYLGDPNAPVVLLNLNPGYVDDDRNVHLDCHFNNAARANLLHKRSTWPLYLLDPSLPDNPGRKWWRGKLSALIAALGSDEAVASLSLLLNCMAITPGDFTEVFAFHHNGILSHWSGLRWNGVPTSW